MSVETTVADLDPPERRSLSPEVVKVFALALGTAVLFVLVLIVWRTQEIPDRAFIGYTVLAAVSLGLGFTLVFPWSEAIREVAKRTDTDAILIKVVAVTRCVLDTLKGGKAKRRREDRSVRESFGLWLPFGVSLVSVGWLIYYSGGLVHSPFKDIPLLMFTLVVLLVDVPTATHLPEADAVEGDEVSIAADQLEASAGGAWPTRKPFWILWSVVVVFYGLMVPLALTWPAEVDEPAAWTAVLITAMTVVVGVPLAIVGRISVVRSAQASAATH